MLSNWKRDDPLTQRLVQWNLDRLKRQSSKLVNYMGSHTSKYKRCHRKVIDKGTLKNWNTKAYLNMSPVVPGLMGVYANERIVKNDMVGDYPGHLLESKFHIEQLMKFSCNTAVTVGAFRGSVGESNRTKETERGRERERGYDIIRYRMLSYRILSYPILSYSILSYRIVSNPILSYPIVSYPTVSYPIVSREREGGKDGKSRRVRGREYESGRETSTIYDTLCTMHDP